MPRGGEKGGKHGNHVIGVGGRKNTFHSTAASSWDGGGEKGVFAHMLLAQEKKPLRGI